MRKHRRIHLNIGWTRHLFATNNTRCVTHDPASVCVRFNRNCSFEAKSFWFRNFLCSLVFIRDHIDTPQTSFCMSAYRIHCFHVERVQVYVCTFVSVCIWAIRFGREYSCWKRASDHAQRLLWHMHTCKAYNRMKCSTKWRQAQPFKSVFHSRMKFIWMIGLLRANPHHHKPTGFIPVLVLLLFTFFNHSLARSFVRSLIRFDSLALSFAWLVAYTMCYAVVWYRCCC